jgi:hypothetical protein
LNNQQQPPTLNNQQQPPTLNNQQQPPALNNETTGATVPPSLDNKSPTQGIFPPFQLPSLLP